MALRAMFRPIILVGYTVPQPWAADVHICRLFFVIVVASDSSYTSSMAVRRRLHLSGSALVFVTTTVTNWEHAFRLPAIAHCAIKQLGEAVAHFDAQLVGYVLIPSHLHAMIGLPRVEKLPKLMQSYKILTSKRIKGLNCQEYTGRFWREGLFHFWKPRYDDQVIFSEEQFATKMEYIHNNPVKAGLVNDPLDWPYSSAVDWLSGGTGLLPIEKEFGGLVDGRADVDICLARKF